MPGEKKNGASMTPHGVVKSNLFTSTLCICLLLHYVTRK